MLGHHLLCRLWPGVLGYDKSLSPRVSDIRVSSDSEAVTEAGTFPSWRSGAKTREGFPEVVPKCSQKDKQKPVRQMGHQRKGLPSKSTKACRGLQLPPSPQPVLSPGSWCKDPANSLTLPVSGSDGSLVGVASSHFQQGSSPSTVIGISCK